MDLVSIALLVMKPAKLLEDLGVTRCVVKNSLISLLGSIKLQECQRQDQTENMISKTDVFLLLVDVADLEPYIVLGKRLRRRCNNISKAL